MKRNMRMRRGLLSTLLIIGLTFCFVIIGGCGYLYIQFLQIFESPRIIDRPPEVVFQSRFMEGLPIPAQVSEIYAIEGSSNFGESTGPTYIRFKATSSFIQDMVTKDYGRNGSYTLIPCPGRMPFNDFLIDQFPDQFEWWQPSEVDKPVCYQAHTCILYDEKFLLIDTSSSIVYFYRTPICGLCPSGRAGTELRESEQCQ